MIYYIFLVNCNSYDYDSNTESIIYWKFKHSKLENHQRYLKSNDTINLSIEKKMVELNFYVVMIFNLLLIMTLFKKLLLIMKD